MERNWGAGNLNRAPLREVRRPQGECDLLGIQRDLVSAFAVIPGRDFPLFGIVLRRLQAVDDNGSVYWHGPGRWGRPGMLKNTSSKSK